MSSLRASVPPLPEDLPTWIARTSMPQTPLCYTVAATSLGRRFGPRLHGE